jgi:hypothetical protein
MLGALPLCPPCNNIVWGLDKIIRASLIKITKKLSISRFEILTLIIMKIPAV